MNQRTKTSIEILQAAVLIGLLGNLLLRQTPWGLNAFLFVTVFVAALLMLMRRHAPQFLTTNTIALMGAMVFFASMFLIRDSIELRVYDTFAIIILMGVVMLVNLGIKSSIAGVFHYAAGVVWAGLNSVFGSFVLLGSDIEWKAMPGNKISRVAFAILRGLAIALPLVLIFGALFVAADAVFEGVVNRVFNFDFETIVSHIVLTSLFAWLSAGYFRGVVGSWPFHAATVTESTDHTSASESESDESPVAKVVAEPGEAGASLPDNASILEHINRSDPPQANNADTKKTKRDWQNFDSSVLPPVFTLGKIEIGIILGLVNALFLVFVIIQVQYLFGGMDLVQNTPDFKLAEYARRGFGELVVVSALVLPILLLSHWLLRRDTGKTETLFRVLAGSQIVLLFVIMASAVQRLVLLTGDLGYGMTTVRFYPMVVMAWLAVVFVWFALTIFRGRRNNFAWGALWAAIVILGATNLMNPDAFIARTNLELMERGREFDGRYNSDLSADAIPSVLSALPSMSWEDQCDVKWEYLERYEALASTQDPRSWSVSRRRAFAALNDHEPELVRIEGCPVRFRIYD